MKKERKELNIHIGANIKSARESAGLTQEKFSEAIDVSVQYVSDLERGGVGTSLQTLINICNTLHVTSDYILFNRNTSPETTLLFEKLARLTPSQYEIIENGVNCLLTALNHSEKK